MALDCNVFIKNLVFAHPKNVPITYSVLHKLGVSHQLLYHYLKNGWLKKIGPQVFLQNNSNVSWQAALFTLNDQLSKKIHVGGRTALEFYGKGHFLALSKQTIFLFKSKKETIPKWFNSLVLEDVETICINSDFLKDDIGIETEEIKGFLLKVSSPERAAFDVLHLLEKHHNFGEIVLLFEGFNNFRPSLIQKLLESCSSKKVKRLMLMLCEYYQFKWLKYIDYKNLDLGSGVMQIENGGHYVPDFKLSLPCSIGDFNV